MTAVMRVYEKRKGVRVQASSDDVVREVVRLSVMLGDSAAMLFGASGAQSTRARRAGFGFPGLVRAMAPSISICESSSLAKALIIILKRRFL